MLVEWFQQLGLMGWPLAFCSVIALAICFERSVFCIKNHTSRERQYKMLADYLHTYKTQPKPVRDELVAMMLNELQNPYYNGIKTLRIIGTISPLFGLLGTILGIIAAFKVISIQPGPVSPGMIAEGLWEAMLTTAIGLLIALPSLLMAHLFRHLSEQQLDDFCQRLNRLSMSFELAKNENELAGNKPAEKNKSAENIKTDAEQADIATELKRQMT